MNTLHKTFSIKPSQISRQWILLDASEAPLGRVATTAAKRLIGKHKPTYTAHIDGGDYVVIINTNKLVVTGSKTTDKKYYRHSGYPGGITEITLGDQIIKDSTKIVIDAIRGMLPKNKLMTERLARLKVFSGPDHTHSAQTPVKIEVRS